MKPSGKGAFTLIELLVVIAIIAILAAILFPVFARAKSAAKQTAALSNMKQCSLATIMYAGDNDDMMPLYNAYYVQPDNVARWISWRLPVVPYTKHKTIFELANFGKTDWEAADRIFWETQWEDAHQGVSFGIAGLFTWAWPGYPALNLTSVPAPANYLAFSTSRACWGDLAPWTMAWQYSGGKGVFVANARKANFGYFDGHVKSSVPAATMGKLDWTNIADATDYQWAWSPVPTAGFGFLSDPVYLKQMQTASSNIPEYR